MNPDDTDTDHNHNPNLLPLLISHYLKQYPHNDRIRSLGEQLSMEFADEYSQLTRQWPNVPYDHIVALVQAGARLPLWSNMSASTSTRTSSSSVSYEVLHAPKFVSEEEYTVFRTRVVQLLRQAIEQRLDCLAMRRELVTVRSSLLRLDRDNNYANTNAENDERTRVESHLRQREITLREKLEHSTEWYNTKTIEAKSAFGTLRSYSKLFQTANSHINSNTHTCTGSIGNILQMIRRIPMSMSTPVTRKQRREMIQSHFIIRSLKHEATINCHQFYPIYCLVMDRTGRYFITGADDHLVKVFRMGGYIPPTSVLAEVSTDGYQLNDSNSESLPRTQAQSPHKGLKFSYTNGSAAVLALTMRGHNGVITDLDVNCDNLLLASASEDGTVRIWGLEKGEIVAVLRHVKSNPTVAAAAAATNNNNNNIDENNVGVNMVKFDLKKPSIVYTIAEDGYCRVWDVRGAVMLRCSQKSSLGKNYKYSSKISTTNGDNNPNNNIVLPPLPGNLPQVQQESDVVDQGCQLLQKLSHMEATGQDRTRANKSKQNVLCISTNPAGEDFVTGSGDGFVRLWKCYENDESISKRTKNPLHLNQQQPILLQPPFQSALTDLIYSNKGDRVLAGALKDAKVRIWSTCTSKNSMISSHRPLLEIRLVQNAANSTSKGVLCDVATWSCDDSLILTSESPSNPSVDKTQISHVKVWCSYTGVLLHVMPTPQPVHAFNVLDRKCIANACIIPHPSIPTLFAVGSSAGALSIYSLKYKKSDYEAQMIYSFINIIKHGPVGDENMRNKAVGFLEGAWVGNNKDSLIMVDEGGRISIYSSHGDANDSLPDWLTEQYFANDYYELAYDPNLYPIDIRSNTLPHLAPRAARTDSQGRSNLDHVSEGNYMVPGPRILCKDEMQNQQENILGKRIGLVKIWNDLKSKKLWSLYGRPKPLNQPMMCETIAQAASKPCNSNQNRSPPRSEVGRRSEPRQLSANYRYLDYAPDSPSENSEDDEEFTVGARTSNRRRLSIESGSDEQSVSMDDDDDELLLPRRRRQFRASTSDDEVSPRRRRRPTNNQRRASVFEQIPNANDVELSSDEGSVSEDEENEEDMFYYTSNRNPTKTHPQVINFPDDYEIPDSDDPTNGAKYLWHLPNITRISRQWLQRKSFCQPGRQTYLPQSGELCVYIPFVHQLTIDSYTTIPHGRIPDEVKYTEVVQCKCINVRYRFVSGYNGLGANVVAVCSMEVKGIPDKSERKFPWIRNFRSGQTTNFELTVMQNDKPEYLIPFPLYNTRLKNLENVLCYQESRMYVNRTGSQGRRTRGNSHGDVSKNQFFETANIHLISYYAEDCFNGGHDPRLEPSKCSLTNVSGLRIDGLQLLLSDDAEPTSGYECLEVTYPGLDQVELICPWEVDCISLDSTEDFPSDLLQTIKVSRLSGIMRNAIKSILNENIPSELCVLPFKEPVDTNVYRDYLQATPLPVCVQFITERIDGNYYSTKSSLLNDIEILLENCIKYNAPESDISNCAKDLCNYWKEKIYQLDEIEEEIVDVGVFGDDVKELLKINQDPFSMDDEAFLNGAGFSDPTMDSTNPRNNDQRQQRQQPSRSALEAIGNGSNQTASFRQAKVTSRRQSSRHAIKTNNETNLKVNTRRSNKEVRSNTQSIDYQNDDDDLSEDDESSDEFHDDISLPRGRAARRKPVKKKNRDSEESSNAYESNESEDDRKIPTRNNRSQRAPSTRILQKSNMKANSDSGELSLESSSDESNESILSTKVSRTKASVLRRNSSRISMKNTQHTLPNSDSPLRKTRKELNYHELSHSDIDDDGTYESDEYSTFEVKSKRRRSTKTSKALSPRKKLMKSDHYEPEIPNWPRVSSRQIKLLGKHILAGLKGLDEMNVFAELPTDDEIPGYSAIIKHPIALVTLEAKLSQYSDINELKDDICLMFRNCCEFTGEGEYKEYTLKLWHSLQDIFHSACEVARINVSK